MYKSLAISLSSFDRRKKEIDTFIKDAKDAQEHAQDNLKRINGR
jgi:hypothetical protein